MGAGVGASVKLRLGGLVWGLGGLVWGLGLVQGLVWGLGAGVGATARARSWCEG